jgi:hypothetical protein
MIYFICSLLLGCKIDTCQTPPCRLLPIIYAISYIIGSISSPSTQRRTSHLNAQNCLAHYRKLTSAPVSMTGSRHHELIVHCIFCGQIDARVPRTRNAVDHRKPFEDVGERSNHSVITFGCLKRGMRLHLDYYRIYLECGCVLRVQHMHLNSLPASSILSARKQW